jgi:hypothetical protein
MSVGSIGGASSMMPAVAAKGERTETHENDHDGDDAKAASSASPSRSVNLSGQVTGTLLHAVA